MSAGARAPSHFQLRQAGPGGARRLQQLRVVEVARLRPQLRLDDVAVARIEEVLQDRVPRVAADGSICLLQSEDPRSNSLAPMRPARKSSSSVTYPRSSSGSSGSVMARPVP